MNKEVFEANIRAIENKFPVWAMRMQEPKRKKRNFTVEAEQSYQGDTILKVHQDGRTLYLNGKYAPEATGLRWLEQQGKIEEFAPIVIVGVGDGIHIRQIMEAVPKTANILIYEPSLELFRRAVEEVDLSFLFALDIPVALVVEGLNENELPAYFKACINYTNMTSMKIMITGNYDELFTEKVSTFMKDLNYFVQSESVGWNTTLRYTGVNAGNVFHNLHYLCEGYSVEQLYGILPEDVPVIVVAAGPSLNKNLMDLKKAQGKACIIATDTAMKPLLNAGIIPHLFVIVDGLKPGLLFEHKELSKVPMVTMTGVSVEPMKMHKGKKFFYYSGSPFEHHILRAVGYKEQRAYTLPYLETGGSVATSAFTLGVCMGARTIILIGQDLALTGNKTHADGTFKEKMEEVDVSGWQYSEVEAIGGGTVVTRTDLKIFLDWYENIIKKWDYVNLVDATEGGALIHGSKVMTLKAAIRKYCKKEFNVKWHIDHSKKIFNETNRYIAWEYMHRAAEKIDEVEKKAREGLKYYDKLDGITKKRKVTNAELMKILKKIGRINDYMSVDYMAQTLEDSLAGLNYTLRPEMYHMKEDKKEELQDISKQGQAMLYGLVVAANEIRPLAEETVVAYSNEHPLTEKELEYATDREFLDIWA